jgi:predicted Zn-dependent protease
MTFKALIVPAVSVAALCIPMGAAAQQSRPRTLSQSTVAQAAQQHPQILAEFGGEETGARGAYIQSVGRKVTAHANVSGGANAFRITTLNSPVMNAFAVPGGYLYVTRQLVGLTDDEAELAFVIGHEAGHIAANHSKQRQTRGLLSQLGALAVGLVTGSSQIGQLAGQISQGLFLSYSRSQEYEADVYGIRYLVAAGYDPTAAASMLESLGAATSLETRASGRNDERATPAWARTHPLSADRVRRATQQAQTLRRPGAVVRNRDQFLAAIDGLMVDDDPRQGIVNGRTFIHPDLRLKFTVPDGYGIQNGGAAVTIAGANGQATFATGRYDGNISTYIGQVYRSLLGEQAQVSIPQPRTVNVNGIPAAYTTARVQTQQGQYDVTVFAYQWGGSTAYHFATVTAAGSGVGPFGPMLQSLTRISAAEAGAIRPRMIDVVTVRAGDTVNSLAARMAYTDLKLERFLTLNSLTASSRLRPGDKVKLVVYGTRS